jgi:hypothetical protein
MTVLEPRGDGAYRQRLSAHIEIDPQSGKVTEIVDGLARDDRGNLEWWPADEALRAELYEALRSAVPIEARKAA